MQNHVRLSPRVAITRADPHGLIQLSGHQAFFTGRDPLRGNPYTLDRGKRLAWLTGWRQGRAAYLERLAFNGNA